MKVWEALEYLDTLVDDSDPDIDLTQIEHAMQTAEAIRRANQPRWFVVTGLVHDLGKILCLWGEPQWAVVGDTFPVGCAYDDAIVYREFLEENPDRQDPRYNTRLGIYREGIGLDNVHLSWGHDEYHLPRGEGSPSARRAVRPAVPLVLSVAQGARVRYPDQRAGPRAPALGQGVQPIRPVSKGDGKPDVKALRPFYEELVNEYSPIR